MKLFKKEPDMKCWNCENLISHKKVKWNPRTFTNESLVQGDNQEEKRKSLEEAADIIGEKMDTEHLASQNQIFGLQEYEYRGKCPECKKELTLFWKGKESFMKMQGVSIAPKIKPFNCVECKEQINREYQVWYTTRVVEDNEIKEYLITLCPKCKEQNGYPFEYNLDKGIIE